MQWGDYKPSHPQATASQYLIPRQEEKIPKQFITTGQKQKSGNPLKKPVTALFRPQLIRVLRHLEERWDLDNLTTALERHEQLKSEL